MNRDQREPRSARPRQRGRDEPPRKRRTPGQTRPSHRRQNYAVDERPMTPEELEAIRQRREARMQASQQYRQQKARQEKRKEQQVKRRKQKRKTDRWEKLRQQTQRAPAKPLSRRNLVIKLVTALAVVLALTLGMTIFFKVGKIQVTGNERYTVQEIIAASGIEEGENLLTFGRPSAAGRILAELPYVGDVQIGIKLPDAVNIDIVELSAAYGIQDTTGQWWLMDSTGKLLQKTDEAGLSGRIRIVGIEARGAAVGQQLAVEQEDKLPEATEPTEEKEATEETETTGETESTGETETTGETESTGETETTGQTEPAGDENTGASVLGTPQERADAALQIMAAIAANDRSGDITVVDVTSLYDIQVHYGDDFQVLLSGPTDLGYKVRYMVQAIEKLVDEGYRGGVLDLSFRQEGKGIFTPW